MQYETSRWERMSDEMVAVMKQKSGIEKLKIASGMWEMAQQFILINLQKEHPAWTLEQCQRETAKRMTRGSV